MKNFATFVVLLLTAIPSAWSQISVTNATFAAPGDVFEVAQDLDITPFTVTPASATVQTWDYSTLSPDLTRQETIIDASTDPVAAEYFPTADIVAPYVDGLITFYAQINANDIRAVGGSINLFGFNLPLALQQPYFLREAPITYNSNSDHTAAFGFDAPVSAIPGLDTILQDLVPIPFATIDSFRIQLNINSTSNVDAFGKLTLPNMPTTDVLRIHRTDELGYGIAAHVTTFLGGFWVDVPTTEIPIPTTVNTYEFRDATHHDALLTAQVPPVLDSVASVSYRYVATPAVGLAAPTQQTTLQLSPNPTQNYCTLVLPPNAQQIVVNDLSGKTLQQITPTANAATYLLDVSNYPTGSYCVVVTAPQHYAVQQLIVSK